MKRFTYTAVVITVVMCVLSICSSCSNQETKTSSYHGRYGSTDTTNISNSPLNRKRNVAAGSHGANSSKYATWNQVALAEMRALDIASLPKNSAIGIFAAHSTELDKLYNLSDANIANAFDEMAISHAKYFAKSFTLNPQIIDSIMQTGKCPVGIPVFISRKK